MKTKPKKLTPGSPMLGGRYHVGRATNKNLLLAAKKMLLPGVKILRMGYDAPFLAVELQRGTNKMFFVFQNVGGLTYLPGDWETECARRILGL